MLLQKISLDNKVYYIEQRTYKEGKIYKNYKITINKEKEEFKRKLDVLLYLKDKE
jgi:hypothetical protein